MSDKGSRKEDIANYLNGTMVGGERVEFEKELSLNQELNKAVSLERFSNKVIIENHLLQVKELLLETHLSSGQGKGWKINGFIISTAILLISTLIFLFIFNKPIIEIRPTSSKSPKVITDNTTVINNVKNKTEEITSEKKIDNLKRSISGKLQLTIQANNLPKVSADSSINSGIQFPAEKIEINKTTIISQVVPLNETINCEQVLITANIYTLPACQKTENGSIAISGIQGGKNPYTIKVYNASQEEVVSTNNLYSGLYKISISDSNKCKMTKDSVFVKEKICKKNFKFNPFAGESWEIPKYSTKGMLVVVDQNGIEYFKKEIPSEGQEYWSGESITGELKSGYFLYTIRYDDGNLEKGSLTLLR